MFDFLPRLESEATAPLYAQLVGQLRNAILDGRLLAGEKLPSTRGFAERLGVSRTTVTEAYDQLLAEGYIVTRSGAGTFVSNAAPGRRLAPSQPAAPRVGAEALSAWGRRLPPPLAPAPTQAVEIDFKPNAAAWDAFPHETWRRLAARAWRRAPTLGLGYGEPAGWRPLREAIAEYLGRARGVRCSPEQIVVVNGSQQALDLLARLCLDPGDRAVIEDPGYPSARRVFAAYRAEIVPTPVDALGLQVDQLPKPGGGGRIKLAYVTPSHQYPTGATLSLGRRLALLQWASANDALVLEDDYDSEFRYAGRPVESLQGLDDDGRVIYLGTYSKVLFPSLRLGYVVLPQALIDPFLAAKDLADRETALAEQRVLADFIAEGHFERHVRRMRQLYAERRAALLDAIAHSAPSRLEAADTQTGMHLLVHVNSRHSETELAQRAADHGVGIYPAGGCWQSPPPRPVFVLGFAGLPTASLVEGIQRLAKAFIEPGPAPTTRPPGKTAP